MLLSLRAKTLTLCLGCALSFPLVRDQFLLYRFLGHTSHPELEQRFKECFFDGSRSRQRVVRLLKRCRFLSWNVLPQLALFCGVGFHALRYIRHRQGWSFLAHKLPAAVAWSILPAIAAFLAPFYLYAYVFVAPPSVCRRITLEYLAFVMDQKDPSWHTHLALLKNGNIVPMRMARQDQIFVRSLAAEHEEEEKEEVAV